MNAIPWLNESCHVNCKSLTTGPKSLFQFKCLPSIKAYFAYISTAGMNLFKISTVGLFGNSKLQTLSLNWLILVKLSLKDIATCGDSESSKYFTMGYTRLVGSDFLSG